VKRASRSSKFSLFLPLPSVRQLYHAANASDVRAERLVLPAVHSSCSETNSARAQCNSRFLPGHRSSLRTKFAHEILVDIMAIQHGSEC
jgi:hypothetical protein